MRLKLCLTAVLVALAAGAAAQDYAAVIKLRSDRMKNDLGGAMKLIDAQLAAGLTDKAAVTAAAGKILVLSRDMLSWFPRGSGPETGWGLAKEEVWTKPADFLAAAGALTTAANDLTRVSAAGSTAAAVDTQFKLTKAACDDCHKTFRIPPPPAPEKIPGG